MLFGGICLSAIKQLYKSVKGVTVDNEVLEKRKMKYTFSLRNNCLLM